MTSKELFEQYGGIKAEIAQLEREISKLRGTGWSYATDAVSGCSAEIPYSKHSVTISGVGQDPRVTRQIEALEKRHRNKLVRLYRSKARAENVLATIPDAITRVILRGYYIDCHSWGEIASQLMENSGVDITEDAVRKRAERFFEKNQ